MNKEKIVVGFLASTDPENKKSFSGIYYRMLKALKYEFESVVQLVPVKEPKLLEIVIKILNISQSFETKAGSDVYFRSLSELLREDTLKCRGIFELKMEGELFYTKHL